LTVLVSLVSYRASVSGTGRGHSNSEEDSWMNVRLTVALVAGLAVTTVAGCAPSAANGGASAGPSPSMTFGGRTLDEGIRPRDNVHTRSAALYLQQGSMSTNPTQRRERFEAALESAMAGIELDADNPRSWFQAGEAYLGLNDVVGADSSFVRAEELHPLYYLEIAPIREQEWVVNYNEAINAINAQDYEQAVTMLERSHTIYRERPEAMLNLGSLYSQLGRNDEAINAYRDALELIRGPLTEEQDDETRAAWAENEEIAAFNVAQLLATTGRNEEAAAAYREYLQRNPDNVTVASNLAVVLTDLGREDEAAQIFNDLLARPGLSSRDYFFTGIGLFQAESYSEAARAFQLSIDASPRNRDAAYNLAQALFLAEEWEALVGAGERLVELDPANQNAFRLWAQGLIQTQNEQRAVEILEQMEAIAFEVVNSQLQPFAGGGAAVYGEVVNLTLSQGTSVRVRFHFLGMDGSALGSADVQVPVGAVEAGVRFEAEFASDQTVAGYYYEVP